MRQRSAQRFQQPEKLIDEIESQFGKPDPRDGNFVRASASPTKIQTEIAKNRFDPRFHDDFAAAEMKREEIQSTNSAHVNSGSVGSNLNTPFQPASDNGRNFNPPPYQVIS